MNKEAQKDKEEEITLVDTSIKFLKLLSVLFLSVALPILFTVIGYYVYPPLLSLLLKVPSSVVREDFRIILLDMRRVFNMLRSRSPEFLYFTTAVFLANLYHMAIILRVKEGEDDG